MKENNLPRKNFIQGRREPLLASVEARASAYPTYAKSNLVFLSLGSNLENRQENIKTAIKKLKKLGAITAISSIYETEPVGYKNQNNFLNLALKLETGLLPAELLKETQKIENEMGRIRKIKDGPRNIDIDIIFYNNKIINTEKLTIPHPKMHQRKFVLLPMKEIAGKTIHPIENKIISELLNKINDNHKIEIWT